MNPFLLACLWLGVAQALFARERGWNTIHKRSANDQEDFFPFLANRSSNLSLSTPPKELPQKEVFLDLTRHSKTARIRRHFIEKNCTREKRANIIEAWGSAKKMAKAQTEFRPSYDDNTPHTQWLGRDWNSEPSWIPWKWNYRKLIGDNLRRVEQLFSDDAPTGHQIYWYCYDYGDACHDDKHGVGPAAYSWDRQGDDTFNHFTVFCDDFHSLLEKTIDKLRRWEDAPPHQKIMQRFQGGRGSVMLHEIYHYKHLASNPRTKDFAYYSQACWDLAKNQGTSTAFVNADSYALDALAIYVQQYYKSSMAPVPFNELLKIDPEAAAAIFKKDVEPSDPPMINSSTQSFETTPPNWAGPLVDDDDPDPSVWTELDLDNESPNDPAPSPSPKPSSSPKPSPSPKPSSNPSPAKDKNACHGISGDYWVMSRDVALDNVEDFCSQSDKAKTYNTDSVNELELSVRNLNDNSKNPKDSPDCVGRFRGAVLDGCDGADYLNNPHNYKFGSTLTTADGWEYEMTPLSKQVNEVNCDVSYKFLFDHFEVRGKNFPDAKLGAEGGGLHEELKGCGALTKWSFERTPDDCCFQWYVSGTLPVGTRACVGRAVVSAGGSDDGNCHGSGKRDGNSSSSIDSWPGYGDDGKHVFRNNIAESR